MLISKILNTWHKINKIYSTQENLNKQYLKCNNFLNCDMVNNVAINIDCTTTTVQIKLEGTLLLFTVNGVTLSPPN